MLQAFGGGVGHKSRIAWAPKNRGLLLPKAPTTTCKPSPQCKELAALLIGPPSPLASAFSQFCSAVVPQVLEVQVQVILQLCGHVSQASRQKNHLVVSCFVPKTWYFKMAPLADSQIAHRVQYKVPLRHHPWLSVQRWYFSDCPLQTVYSILGCLLVPFGLCCPLLGGSNSGHPKTK